MLALVVMVVSLLHINYCHHLLMDMVSYSLVYLIQPFFWSTKQITHMEMIKGIQGHGYYDELVVPIIENTAYESELTESLAKAVCSFHTFNQPHAVILVLPFLLIYGMQAMLLERNNKDITDLDLRK